MTLKTRQPTGMVPWPLILIEGGEKCGKSFSCALLSASAKVGRTLWLDWGEGAADEYGAIPGARYEVIEHDGTWADIMAQLAEAKGEAQRAKDAGEPPVVLVLDSITAEWEQLKDWASERARTQRANREKLARDPNAEVTVSMNLWNDAASRHRKLMTLLMTFPGIVVVTARGGDVAAVEAGKPVEGRKAYRVEGHKSLAFDASCWIRLSREAKPLVVGARSVHAGVRPGIDAPKTLPDDWTLEWLIFDALRCNPATAHIRDLVEPRGDIPTPEQIRDEALESTTPFERIQELYAIAWEHHRDVSLTGDTGDDEPLTAILRRIGDERRGACAAQCPAPPQTAADAFAQGTSRPANGNGHANGRPHGQISRPAEQQAQPFPQADEAIIREWAAKIDACTGADDCDKLAGELRQLQVDRKINPATANAIRRAIQAKREMLAQQFATMAGV